MGRKVKTKKQKKKFRGNRKGWYEAVRHLAKEIGAQVVLGDGLIKCCLILTFVMLALTSIDYMTTLVLLANHQYIYETYGVWLVEQNPFGLTTPGLLANFLLPIFCFGLVYFAHNCKLLDDYPIVKTLAKFQTLIPFMLILCINLERISAIYNNLTLIKEFLI